jgi:trehalose-6-phosphate synthase
MPQPERQRRAAAMREQVRRANVQVWFDHQLDDALKDWYSQPSRASTPSIP